MFYNTKIRSLFVMIYVLQHIFNRYLNFIDLGQKNRHKAQRKAKFYINKCRSASCMQGGLKQASA